jgi:hypothetical protein
MALQETKESENRNTFKKLLFLLMSIFLATVIVVVSLTSILVMSFFGAQITEQLLLIFAAVIVINAGIIIISLRGLVRILPQITRIIPAGKPAIIIDQKPILSGEPVDNPAEIDAKFLSGIELEIIEMIHEHGDRMLQNEVTGSFRVSKATISRSISSLERKNVVIKNRKGVTNEIILVGKVR